MTDFEVTQEVLFPYQAGIGGASPSLGFFYVPEALPMGVRSRTERALRHLRRWRPWWLYRDEEERVLSVVIDPDLWTDYGRRLVAKWERAWADIDLSGPWTETPAQVFRRGLARAFQADLREALDRAILGEGTGRPQGIIVQEHEDEEPWLIQCEGSYQVVVIDIELPIWTDPDAFSCPECGKTVTLELTLAGDLVIPSHDAPR